MSRLKVVFFVIIFVSFLNQSWADDKTSTGFYYPTGNDVFGTAGAWLASGCGENDDYFDGYYHIGRDMQADEDDPVYAISDGIVVQISLNGWGTGNVAIFIKHKLSNDNEFLALYGHIKTELSVNDRVYAGKEFATIGYWEYGDHLHFGVINGTSTPPSNFGRMDCEDWFSTNTFTDPVYWIEDETPYPNIAHYSDGWHDDSSNPDDPSQPIFDAYTENGGYDFFGLPVDNDGGEEVHYWPTQGDPSDQDVMVLQDFEDEQAIVLSPGRGKAFYIQSPISDFWFGNSGYEDYGSPMTNPVTGRYIGGELGNFQELVTVQKFGMIDPQTGGSIKTIGYNNGSPSTAYYEPMGVLTLTGNEGDRWYIDEDESGTVSIGDKFLFELDASGTNWMWADAVYYILLLDPAEGDINTYPHWVLEGNDQHFEPTGNQGTQAPVLATPTINSSSWVDLSWTDSNDPDAYPYKVYRDGIEIGQTTNKQFTDYTTVVGHTYVYIVSGNGTPNSDPEVVTVTDEGGAGAPAPTGDLRVVWPNGGEVLIPEGYSYDILWNGSDAGSVRIKLSRDNGDTWTKIVDYSNSGSYLWWDPGSPASDECLIWVANLSDTTEYDVSDNTFTIGNPNDPPIADSFVDSTAYPDTLFIDLSDRVTDNDGDPVWSTLSVVSVTNGTAAVDVANQGINFVPTFRYFGPAEVRYRIKDDDEAYSNTAIVSIDIYVVTSDFENGNWETQALSPWEVGATDTNDVQVSYVFKNFETDPDYSSYVLDVDIPAEPRSGEPDTVTIIQTGLHFTVGAHVFDFEGRGITRDCPIIIELYTYEKDSLLWSHEETVYNRLWWDYYSVPCTLSTPVVEAVFRIKFETDRLYRNCQLDSLIIDEGSGPSKRSAESGDIETESEIPKAYALYQNYPNPFNPETIIKFDLPEDARVRVDIFNILGQKVITLVDRDMSAGQRSVTWQATNGTGSKVPTGIYIYRLVTDKYSDIKKMILLK